MNTFFSQAGPWERLRYELIAVPLLSASRDLGSLPSERIQVVRAWLEELRPWLVEGGIPRAQVNDGLTVVLGEINQRVVHSVWPWNLVAGTRPRAHR